MLNDMILPNLAQKIFDLAQSCPKNIRSCSILPKKYTVLPNLAQKIRSCPILPKKYMILPV